MSRWQTAPVERPDAVDANASNIRRKLRPGQRLRGGQRTGAVATVVILRRLLRNFGVPFSRTLRQGRDRARPNPPTSERAPLRPGK